MNFTQKMCPTESYLPAKFQEHRCKSTLGRPLGEIIAHAHLDVKMSEAGLTSVSLAARLIIEGISHSHDSDMMIENSLSIC